MTRRRLILALCCLPLLFLIYFYFGYAPDAEKRYVPAATDARQAVETALSTWKSGAKHGTITSSKVKIDVFDARWQVEKKNLESYMIIEDIPGQPQPQFKVRLKLVGKQEETNTYLVVGNDPLQVFRDDDYQKSFGATIKGM